MSLVKKIFRENLISILVAVFISSIGGSFLEHEKSNLLAIPILIIIVPALNDMVGDFGCIIASRFSTMFYKDEIRVREYIYTGFRIIPRNLKEKYGNSKGIKLLRFIEDASKSYLKIFKASYEILKNSIFKDFIKTIALVSFISSIYLGILSVIVAYFLKIEVPPFEKIIFVSLFSGLSLVTIISLFSIFLSVIAIKNRWDLDNIIIPIVTAVGDVSGIAFLLLSAKYVGLI